MAALCNIPFSIERKDIVLVKPSTPTPSEVLLLSTFDNNPNLVRIGQIIFSYKANDQLSNSYSTNNIEQHVNQADPACIIEEALSKLLVYYYPLAGKLKRQSDGKLQINCNADGVPFSVATADCKLSSLNYLDGIDVAVARRFVLDLPSDFDNGCHPLMFQVTKFTCGGFTVAMGMAHSVFDGYGAAHFYRALTEIASKKSEPSVKPVWQRERLMAKPSLETPEHLHKKALATSPYLPTQDVVHEYFYVTADSIKRLKSLSSTDETQDEVTTLEVLGAYIWRSRFRALKLDPNGTTAIRLAVGIRHLFNPPLPDGYYGNAFIAINVVLTGRDLNEGPLSMVVKLIKESKKLASTEEYIRTAMSMMEKRRLENSEADGATGGLMVLTDWRQLGVQGEVDFGWKGFVNITSLPWKIYGDVDLCILMSPCKLDRSMKGGVKVLVSLPRASMAKFREEMDALKHGPYLTTLL
ncbi:hypothetical protein PTKIN_Ptkin03bG0003700 [Pterospermum kingtungense]